MNLSIVTLKGALLIVETKILSSLRQYITPSDSRLDEDKWDIWEGATIGEVLKMLNCPKRSI